MVELDKITGLPKELVEFEQIGKETERIRIRVTKRRLKKLVTIISGIENHSELKDLIKLLKKKLACGGTIKGNEIELQGAHKAAVKEILVKEGYGEDKIDA